MLPGISEVDKVLFSELAIVIFSLACALYLFRKARRTRQSGANILGLFFFFNSILYSIFIVLLYSTTLFSISELEITIIKLIKYGYFCDAIIAILMWYYIVLMISPKHKRIFSLPAGIIFIIYTASVILYDPVIIKYRSYWECEMPQELYIPYCFLIFIMIFAVCFFAIFAIKTEGTGRMKGALISAGLAIILISHYILDIVLLALSPSSRFLLNFIGMVILYYGVSLK